jgi:hypothetical protein
MVGKKRGKRLVRQFVGEIATEIVDWQDRDATVESGAEVKLERERSNPRDRWAIRVENGRFQPVGYVPQQVSSWLAPLLDAGKADVEGYVPSTAAPGTRGGPLGVMAFLSAEGLALLDGRKAPANHDASHRLVLSAYENVQTTLDPQSVLDLVRRFEPLASQDLLPETRLLLALLPGVARDLLAAGAFQARAVLETAMAHLTIGEPVCSRGVTVFPLFTPGKPEPSCVLACRAIEIGVARLKHIRGPGDTFGVRLQNRGLLPILVPEGELTCGNAKIWVNTPVLVPPKSMAVIRPGAAESERPRCCQADDRQQGQMADRQPPVHGLKPFRLPEGASGVAVGQGDRVLAVHLFDRPATMSSLYSHVLSTAESDRFNDPMADPTPRDAVEPFLRRIAAHARITTSNTGAGEELQIDGPGVVGRGLFYDNRICHLVALSRPEGRKNP